MVEELVLLELLVPCNVRGGERVLLLKQMGLRAVRHWSEEAQMDQRPGR